MKNYGFIRTAAAVPVVRIADTEHNAAEICRLAGEAFGKEVSLVVFPESSSSSVTPQSSDSETSVSIAESLRAPAMRYIAADRRLEIGVAGSFRVDVVRMDGTKVLSSASRVVDLSGLRAGVYVVRLVSAGSALQLKILKSAP